MVELDLEYWLTHPDENLTPVAYYKCPIYKSVNEVSMYEKTKKDM